MVPYQYEYPEESWGEHGEATMLDEDQVPSSGQANSRHAADSHLDSTPSPAWPHRWSSAPVKHGRGSGKNTYYTSQRLQGSLSSYKSSIIVFEKKDKF